MFRIGNPQIFYTVFVLIGIIIFFYYNRKWRIKKINLFGDYNLLLKQNQHLKSKSPTVRFVIYSIAILLIIIGMSNPQYGKKAVEVKKKGIDIVLALDLSNSMLTEDIKPNRLIRAKNAIYKLLKKLQGDRISIVIFAGEAFTQLPLTNDYAAAQLFINNLEPSMIRTQGTSISMALQQSLISFGNIEIKGKKRSRTVILITDGEDHEKGIETVMQKINSNGVILNVVGIATEKGGPIPVFNERGIKTGFKKDRQNNIVFSRLNENMMKDLAKNGKGIFVNASSGNLGLNEIYDKISSMEKSEIGTKKISDYITRYQWLLIPALFLLIIESLLLNNRYKLFDKFKISIKTNETSKI